jgi:hypothetical protein
MDDVQYINQTLDLLAFVEGSTDLRKSGRYYFGPCPFCGGTDRFVMKPTEDGWRWYCRRCGDEKYHTSIDFIMKMENLSFLEAISWINGVTPPSPRFTDGA